MSFENKLKINKFNKYNCEIYVLGKKFELNV